MTKDIIVRKIKDKNSSVLWKIMFMMIINLRTPVLFIMLFIGNQNFNLFTLGFMIFFVAFGASDWLYSRTSIILPSFISYFILCQYYWSLIYSEHLSYNAETDFWYLVDGWTPPSDPNDFYWARKPNLTLWGLLFLMYSLHTIGHLFPDNE